jgi:hypothetical protein
MSLTNTTCAFCGDSVRVDERGILLLHHIISPQKLHGCGKYEEQPHPLVVCPFSGIEMIENLVHLTRTTEDEKDKR